MVFTMSITEEMIKNQFSPDLRIKRFFFGNYQKVKRKIIFVYLLIHAWIIIFIFSIMM